MIHVIDPQGRPNLNQQRLAPRLETLKDKRLGLLSNGKPNAANLLRIVERRLASEFNLGEVVFVDKFESSLTAADTMPDWMLEQLSQCDAVLHGSGD